MTLLAVMVMSLLALIPVAGLSYAGFGGWVIYPCCVVLGLLWGHVVDGLYLERTRKGRPK